MLMISAAASTKLLSVVSKPIDRDRQAMEVKNILVMASNILPIKKMARNNLPIKKNGQEQFANKNIARGTTDPGYRVYNLSYLQLKRMPLALVPNLANCMLFHLY